MPYDLVPQSDTGQIVEAINYLLNNLNNGLNSDPSTGEIVGPNNQVVGYLYKYIAVKYADSYDGSVNFSDSPTNRQYYGLRNSDSSVESTNPADYIWTQVTGGFSTTKLLYYTTTGGRQIDFRVDTSLPAVEWAPVPTGAIDLDVVTSGSVLSTTFVAFFQPSTLQVPYTTGPNFTGVIAKLYASNSQGYVNFSTAQNDSDPGFTNNTWRIGNSSSTGNGDISYANITVGAPTDGGGFAQWPAPTAMSASPALITVPVRYKSSTGVVSQASPASIQITFSTSGQSSRLAFARIPGNPTPTSGTIQTSGAASYPTSGQSASVWGISTVWSGIDPSPSSTDSLYQSEGSYDPVTNVTTWTTPYISSLRVGTLSAITVNTGALTVTGDLQAGNIVRSGSTVSSGSGAVIEGNTGYFALGNTSGSVVYNGSVVRLNGSVVMDQLTAIPASGSRGSLEILGANTILQINRTSSTSVPAVYVYDTSGASTESFYVADTSSASHTYAAGFAGNVSGGITLYVASNGSGSGAAKFFNNNASKQFWAAPGAYSAYSPSGGGKIYIVDGNGPFTGFHDTLTPINNEVNVGDIMVDTQLIYKADVNSTLFETATSTQPNQSRTIGIASSVTSVVPGTPGSLWINTDVQVDGSTINQWSMPEGFDPATIESTYKVVQVNALGEGQINVCGENGDIQPGDLIVTSSMSGKGMKQSDDVVRSITVAKAREAATFTSGTEVKQIACIYLCG
jgi:hypothetical protein